MNTKPLTASDLRELGAITVGWDRSPVLATDFQIDGVTQIARTPPDEKWLGVRLAPCPMPTFMRLPEREPTAGEELDYEEKHR